MTITNRLTEYHFDLVKMKAINETAITTNKENNILSLE